MDYKVIYHQFDEDNQCINNYSSLSKKPLQSLRSRNSVPSLEELEPTPNFFTIIKENIILSFYFGAVYGAGHIIGLHIFNSFRQILKGYNK